MAAARSSSLTVKGRRPKPTPLCYTLWRQKQGYIFFSEHTLVVASHVPPAVSQSAWFFALVTSPAKAGPVKASAKANANVETSVFMVFLPWVLGGVPQRTLAGREWFLG